MFGNVTALEGITHASGMRPGVLTTPRVSHNRAHTVNSKRSLQGGAIGPPRWPGKQALVHAKSAGGDLVRNKVLPVVGAWRRKRRPAHLHPSIQTLDWTNLNSRFADTSTPELTMPVHLNLFNLCGLG